MTEPTVMSQPHRGIAARVLAHPVARILAVLALSRAVTVLLLLVLKEVPLAEPVTGGIGNLLCRFDCSWYLRLATGGYSIDSPAGPDNTTYAFFPLYPSIVGLVSRITTISPLTTGIVLSTAFFALALIYVYYYARDVGFSHRTGMLAVAILCFAPASVVFSSVFSESLFILLLAAAVFHMRREEYGRAALAAALLTATRPNGIAIIAFALVFALKRLGLGEFLRPWRRPEVYLPVVLAPLGLFAYWGFSYSTTGDAFAHISTNVHGWGWGMTGAVEMLTSFTRLDASDKLLMGVSGVTLGLSFLLLRYRLFAEFALVLASLAIYWTGGLAPWSMPRFALVLFPLSVVVARTVESRPGLATVLVASTALAGGFMLAAGWGLEGFVI